MHVRQTAQYLHRSTRGFSLIELLVSMVIGLVVTLAIFGVLAASEGRKRTSVSVNDANQSGSYAAYALDRLVRSAGTGYAQSTTNGGVLGCRINAATQASQTLPRAAPFPAPFAAVPQSLRLAPVIIFQGASASGSDVLMVMNGTAGFGEAPVAMLPRNATDAATNQWRLDNTIGFRSNDLVMLAGGGECLLTQLAAVPAGAGNQVLPFNTAGSYYTATATNTSLATLATIGNTQAFVIGNLDEAAHVTDNLPQFQLFGVGANNTLFSYDLLVMNGQNAPLPLAEGVVALRAVYGVDTTGDGRIDDWVAPTGTTWGGSELMSGASSFDNLRRIIAVRIGIVMRSSLIEKTQVAPILTAGSPPTYGVRLFADLTSGGTAGALTRTVSIATADATMRYRTIELTIPVRNLLLRP